MAMLWLKRVLDPLNPRHTRNCDCCRYRLQCVSGSVAGFPGSEELFRGPDSYFLLQRACAVHIVPI